MKINLKALSAIGLLTAAGAAMAADEPAAPAAPTGPSLASVLEASGITATGYVSAGAEYVNTIPSYRVFDTDHDSFSLHQAALTLAYQPKEGFGALVNVIAGSDASVLHSSPNTGGDFDVTQAFFQYATGITTVIAGKFATLAGAEVIAPTGNTNSSRGILFGNVPFTHTGVRATFAPTEELSFIVGVNNGWDQIRDVNTQKTVELGFAYTTKPFVLAAQVYVGGENTVLNLQGSRQLLDVVATFNATDSLSFVLNADIGKQENANAAHDDAKWDGLAAYVNFGINDMWRISGRAEYFDDKDGYKTGAKQKLKEATFTLAAMPSKNAEVRFEVRYDKSDVESFTKVDGSATDNQASIGVEALYKF